MIQQSVDIYLDGALHERAATIARQGSEIRISGAKPAMRFTEVETLTEGARLVYRGTDSSGNRVQVVGLPSADCGCNKKG